MVIERRKYTEAFKREAVQLMETSGKPIAELARDLGINDNHLYGGRGMYGSRSQGSPKFSVAEMEAELKRLRRAVAVLRFLTDSFEASSTRPRAFTHTRAWVERYLFDGPLLLWAI